MIDRITPIDSGGIMLSYRCSNRCRHCLYGAGPTWNDWMDIHDAQRIFHGLLETSRHLRGFHIAGGEPFLDFDRLLRVQRLATEFGIPIEYVETNSGWCVSDLITRQRFTMLRDAGLRCVLVSCSPFHAETIPLDRIITAVKIGYEVFGPSGVFLWTPEFYKQLSKIRTDRVIKLEEYVSSVTDSVAKYMIRSGYSLITGGRIGYCLADFYERRPAERCRGEHCRPELLESGHAHFDPYGNLIPSFCSGISLGDATDLPGLMQGIDMDSLPLVRMLAKDGPYALYEFAVREFGYEPIEAGYVGKCHLCVDVRRWIRKHTDQYRELCPAKFYEEILS